jgi:hypothetical protein
MADVEAKVPIPKPKDIVKERSTYSGMTLILSGTCSSDFIEDFVDAP